VLVRAERPAAANQNSWCRRALRMGLKPIVVIKQGRTRRRAPRRSHQRSVRLFAAIDGREEQLGFHDLRLGQEGLDGDDAWRVRTTTDAAAVDLISAKSSPPGERRPRSACSAPFEANTLSRPPSHRKRFSGSVKPNQTSKVLDHDGKRDRDRRLPRCGLSRH